ncbi:MAG: cytochrome c biogenesis protein CcdA [Spirosomataceae bacterium]
MRKLSLFLILLSRSLFSFAQIETPTTWTNSVSNLKPKVGETIELRFEASIKKGWYLYSSDFDPEIGPIVTTFSFKPSKEFKLIGGITPKNPKTKFDEIWGANIKYFIEKAVFIQKIQILSEKTVIPGEIEFQSCTDVDGRCINGKEKFTFTVVASPAEKPVAITDSLLLPEKDTVGLTALSSTMDSVQAQIEPQEADEVNAESNKKESSLLDFLFIAFMAGLASIFMPCIYPIMPMTVSFFTKQEKGKFKAIFYGVSIMAIFSVMGFVTMLFGAPFLNFISTHWIPNLIFFILFIVFGISLLGAFEIVMPHETVNKIDQLSEKGGLVGIFFMALTLVVVSFSCTVPFVGSLLIYSSQGEVMRPLYGMLAFGLPFALVFSGLAMFPQFLKTLPKSGGWLNELKAVFGLLEFALALKFLSNIDLAYHLNLIHRNLFLLIWIVIGVLITLYILGLIRFSKDNRVEKFHWSRLFFAFIFAALTLYMVPGITGKPLSALSGILPPAPIENAENASNAPAENMRALPHNLWGFYDIDDAKAYAAKVNKPILIDFTGYACANCRKMEENVWPKPDVKSILGEVYVIASLYVDDKKELPREKQYLSSYSNEMITTIGAKNMEYEITQFNNNAQPYYVIIDAKGKILMNPIGYSSEKEFLDWLKEGEKKFSLN